MAFTVVVAVTIFGAGLDALPAAGYTHVPNIEIAL